MTSQLNVANFNRDANGSIAVKIDGETSVEIPVLTNDVLTVNSSGTHTGAVTGQVTVATGYPIKVTVTDDPAPPGACTIAGTSGKVAIAAGATSVVITHSGVTTATKCFCQKLSLDATLTDFKAVCTSTTITITGNAAATADCYFDFIIFSAA